MLHLICSHDNADFDAVASVLAAHKLYPDTTPIIPYRQNRNVRDFVALYGREFPFRQLKDLPKKPHISRLTLVDTQRLPQIPPLPPTTPIQIIDHHPPIDLPEQATLDHHTVGAATTILVEALQRQAIRLSPIEATLCMLGIYEDTGALTYTNTTPRDMAAATWLLAEGGAYIDLLREYLNYGLTPEQQAVYQQLVSNATTETVDGQVILLANASSDSYIPEISKVAHRLRDLFQSAALFIMVELPNHLQMVARSASEAIDVGRIMAEFGGGGHPRAGAATIIERSLNEILADLRAMLPRIVKPALTVAQVMSRGKVHTLQVTQTMGDAAQAIDRYGHEGFPVLNKAGQLVGILNRREVDKAMRHKLYNTRIDQFMTVGQFHVHPADGMAVVRQRMLDNQIGQLPVLELESGQIIGIITRTDLLKLEANRRADPQPTNLTAQVEAELSDETLDLLHTAGQIARDQHSTIYIVGGFVRDLLLNQQNNDATSPRFDLDLVVEGDGITVANALQTALGGHVHQHDRFRTANWFLDQPIPFDRTGHSQLSALDLVTARAEFYRHPSALPEIEPSSMRHDLHRRDFTLNTLAVSLHPDHFGDLLDFYGGQADLVAGQIRILHSLSFVEDPTRLLRAVRLMARFDFRLESRTAKHFRHALDLISQLSPERLYHELELINHEQDSRKAWQLLEQWGLLAMIHPELHTSALPSPDDVPETTLIEELGLMLFHLNETAQNAVAERLNLRATDRKTISHLSYLHDHIHAIRQAEQASTLDQLLHPTNAEARRIAYLAVSDEQFRAQIIRYTQKIQPITTLIDGTFLRMNMGIRPGPIYREILSQLRAARLDGLVMTLADEQKWVKNYLG